MFLFNSFEACRSLREENKNNFHHWANEIKNKHTWFSRKIFVFYKKWKIKNALVLDVRSASTFHTLKLFESNKACFLLPVSNVYACAEVCACGRTAHMSKPGLGTRLQFYKVLRFSWYFLISKIISLKSHNNLVCNPYIPCLLPITLYFTCGERKIW